MNGAGLRRFGRRHPDVFKDDHAYDPGGPDPIHLEAPPLPVAHELLRDDAFVKAARLMNWRLMKKGPSAYGRYHSFPLGDRIVPIEG